MTAPQRRVCAVPGCGLSIKPQRGKGFTREQLAWAEANAHADREARMILVMAADPAARRAVGGR